VLAAERAAADPSRAHRITGRLAPAARPRKPLEGFRMIAKPRLLHYGVVAVALALMALLAGSATVADAQKCNHHPNHACNHNNNDNIGAASNDHNGNDNLNDNGDNLNVNDNVDNVNRNVNPISLDNLNDNNANDNDVDNDNDANDNNGNGNDNVVTPTVQPS
jgi:hypothetical protein